MPKALRPIDFETLAARQCLDSLGVGPSGDNRKRAPFGLTELDRLLKAGRHFAGHAALGNLGTPFLEVIKALNGQSP